MLKPIGIHLSQHASERSQGGMPQALVFNLLVFVLFSYVSKMKGEWLGKGILVGGLKDLYAAT